MMFLCACKLDDVTLSIPVPEVFIVFLLAMSLLLHHSSAVVALRACHHFLCEKYCNTIRADVDVLTKSIRVQFYYWTGRQIKPEIVLV